VSCCGVLTLRSPPCLQCAKLETSSSTPEEAAAAEFCSLDGVGEATAIVLARSTALGGSQHGGLESLRAWAGATGERRLLPAAAGAKAAVLLRASADECCIAALVSNPC
jgi:hypothetical protein